MKANVLSGGQIVLAGEGLDPVFEIVENTGDDHIDCIGGFLRGAKNRADYISVMRPHKIDRLLGQKAPSVMKKGGRCSRPQD